MKSKVRDIKRYARVKEEEERRREEESKNGGRYLVNGTGS